VVTVTPNRARAVVEIANTPDFCMNRSMIT
jgi:hypothetical protein